MTDFIIAATFGLSVNLTSLLKLYSFRKICYKIKIFGDIQVCSIEIDMGPMPFAENYTVVKFSHVDWL